MRFASSLTVAGCAVLLLGSLAADERSMSFNDLVRVVPAPGPVVVDGKSDDWDLSAGVWSYNDPTIVDRYSVWTHLMWDAKGVYFLARVHDQSPMQNAAAGRDFSVSWKADCYQARVIFDDRADAEHIMHVNMYWSSPDQKPYMIIKHGGFKSKAPFDATGPDRPDQLEHWGSTMTAAGGSLACAPWDDGKGYCMEAFWPWSFCRTSGEALKPGDRFTFGTETMWGNSDGTKLGHRLADGIVDETVNRIFMFRARDGWGHAVISDKGSLTITEEQQALQKERLRHFQDYDTYGSIPLAYTLPEDRDVTIAIDDANGHRVRNLFGQYPRNAGSVKDVWDGLDDEGNPVTPGAYTASVVHHKPIGLKLYNSAYSSSTPPWTTEKGSLFWGSNHGHPTSVATKGDVTILFFTGTEGGSGIQRINDDGIISWCDGQEFLDGTIDDTYVYGLSRSSWQKKTLLFRYTIADGKMTPFDDAERTPSPTLLDDANIPSNSSLAYAHNKIWAMVPGRDFMCIDPKTGSVEKRLPTAGFVAISDRNDVLYALRSDGALVILDAEGKEAQVLGTVSGLKDPQRIAIDQDGKRALISDHGTNQVVLCDLTGKEQRRFGKSVPGNERPAGTFITTNLIKPMGCGFDHLGRIWIPEGVQSCKRVGLWSDDGKLTDQFWGQADYGAMAAFPITNDRTRFIAHGIEFALDPDPDPWHRKTNEQPLIFHPELSHQRGLVYEVDGREYACGAPGYNQGQPLLIYRRDEQKVFVPCARLSPKRKSEAGSAWLDANGNGLEESNEVIPFDFKVMYWSNGWVRPDLSIVTTDGLIMTPKGFSSQGVPLYDFANPQRVPNWLPFQSKQGSGGTPIMDLAGNISDGIIYRTIDGHTGAYPNRFGRHDAPAAQRGLLIAPFRTNGVVEDVPNIGSITALGGDRGEWFVMSMDGIYLSSICQDIKGNVILDETLTGGESFGGFLWRDQETGKVLVQLGGASYRLMEVTGLETCEKIKLPLTVSEDLIRKGVAIAQERQQQIVAEPERLRIAAVRNKVNEPAPVMQPLSKPLMDGAVDVVVSEPGNAAVWWRAAMAIQGKDLVVMWQVADTSPWLNESGQYTHAFIGGDAVDVQLDIPGRGAVRLLGAKVGGKNTVIYSQAEQKDASNPVTYSVGNNVSNATTLAVVKRLESATLQTSTGFNSYTALMRVPLADLGLDKARGSELRGVVGVIFSDPTGTNRASRLYWHDKQTGLVNDVPSEARLSPKRWGSIDIDR